MTQSMSHQIEVAQASQLLPGQARLVRVNHREIALFNVDGVFYAIDNICSHSRGPLVEGRLAGLKVTCPWHGSQFDVTTGKCLREPATAAVASYSVHVEDDIIFVEIP